MLWLGLAGDKMPVNSGSHIQRNSKWFTRPFEVATLTGHFIFSHGHFILNAGYSTHFNTVFQWEEPYQTYLAWKAGYQLYSPNESFVFHLYDRSYRPAYEADINT